MQGAEGESESLPPSSVRVRGWNKNKSNFKNMESEILNYQQLQQLVAVARDNYAKAKKEFERLEAIQTSFEVSRINILNLNHFASNHDELVKALNDERLAIGERLNEARDAKKQKMGERLKAERRMNDYLKELHKRQQIEENRKLIRNLTTKLYNAKSVDDIKEYSDLIVNRTIELNRLQGLAQ